MRESEHPGVLRWFHAISRTLACVTAPSRWAAGRCPCCNSLHTRTATASQSGTCVGSEGAHQISFGPVGDGVPALVPLGTGDDSPYGSFGVSGHIRCGQFTSLLSLRYMV